MISARSRRGRRRYIIHKSRQRKKGQNRRRIRLIREHMFMENYIHREENEMIENVKKFVTFFCHKVTPKNRRYGPRLKFISAYLGRGSKAQTPKGLEVIIGWRNLM